MEREPAVDIQVRTGSDTFTHVYGNQWPLEQTRWTRYFLDARREELVPENPEEEASVLAVWRKEPEVGSSKQVTFRSLPLEEDVTVAGPITAHLWVSTEGRDVDLTVELRDYDSQGRETRFAYVFPGSPDEPVTRGWLRVSRRALDPERSSPYQPWHLHSRSDWLTPGVPVEVDVELWPTGMVFKAGHRIALTIHCGKYKRKGEAYFRVRPLPFLPAITLRNSIYKACSPPAGETRIHTGGKFASWLKLPVIPPDPAPAHRITIRDDRFEPVEVRGEMGDRFEWTNAGSDYHSVTEASGLGLWDSQLVRGGRSHNPETWWLKLPWAATFVYRDMVSGFKGAIAVPPRVPARAAAGERIPVLLGIERPPERIGFDVQLREGGGEWRTVKEGLTGKETKLDPLKAGAYAVRARLRSLEEDVHTDWSPVVTFELEE
ncbi:MAG: CocE/NonD family hydrolase C-terminal non-catalytic domain-containing protein [Actinomycetota bacterium]